jgi:hypothetical protein
LATSNLIRYVFLDAKKSTAARHRWARREEGRKVKGEEGKANPLDSTLFSFFTFAFYLLPFTFFPLRPTVSCGVGECPVSLLFDFAFIHH